LKELSITLFSNFGTLIIFLHVLSAIIWIGGMIAIRFAVHYSVQTIQEVPIKLHTALLNLKYFFNIVIICIFTLLISAIIMSQSLSLDVNIVHYKEAIWTMMTLIFIVVVIKRNKAEHYFKNNDFKNAKAQLEPIAKYLIPINIILGITALFFGIIL
jgi:uncharacterized membrane protein